MTDPIRAKIIKLVPDVELRRTNRGLPGVLFEPAITLADVLRALPIGIHLKTLGEQTRMIAYDEEGAHEGIEWWDCTTDYDGQTQEVKEFIGSLLNV